MLFSTKQRDRAEIQRTIREILTTPLTDEELEGIWKLEYVKRHGGVRRTDEQTVRHRLLDIVGSRFSTAKRKAIRREIEESGG